MFSSNHIFVIDALNVENKKRLISVFQEAKIGSGLSLCSSIFASLLSKKI